MEVDDVYCPHQAVSSNLVGNWSGNLVGNFCSREEESKPGGRSAANFNSSTEYVWHRKYAVLPSGFVTATQI